MSGPAARVVITGIGVVSPSGVGRDRFALLATALWSGAASLLAFGVLLLARIRVEERALGLRAR